MQKLGNSAYTIEYLEDVVTTDIPSLAKSAKELIMRAIEDRLVVDPIKFGKPLRHDLSGYRSLRVSKYRIIYQIDVHHRIVTISAIHHRKDAYD